MEGVGGMGTLAASLTASLALSLNAGEGSIARGLVC